MSDNHRACYNTASERHRTPHHPNVLTLAVDLVVGTVVVSQRVELLVAVGTVEAVLMPALCDVIQVRTRVLGASRR